MLFMHKWKLNFPHSSSLQSVPTKQKAWHPPALRKWNLLLATLICWVLIIVLQYLLIRSQKESGILFAANVNNLPLKKTFTYLYMPTIIAIILSIYWAWIDLDAKRSEPYYQLTKENGALGKDSLLLHYPLDFIPLVPFIALKRRHFLVFWTSLSTVLLTFGLIPIQAGIFSTSRVTRTLDTTFMLSNSIIPASNQSTAYTNSVYNIARFNETLPPYMTREYALRPFVAMGNSTALNTTWTAQTTMYGLDLNCTRPDTRQVVLSPTNSELDFRQGGCHLRIQRFYHDSNLHSFFSLNEAGEGEGRIERFTDVRCNPQRHMFFSAYVRPIPFEANSLFCDILHYERSVEATVEKTSRTPLAIRPLGPKKILSPDDFNIALFERAISLNIPLRAEGALPVLPNIDGGASDITANTNMLKLSESMCANSKVDWMNPNDLSDCYLRAFRLFFARAMALALETKFEDTTSIPGTTTLKSEAVVVEPVFVHIGQAFLGLVSVSALALLFLIVKRGGDPFYGRMFSDPGTIASIMSLSADNHDLLSKMEDLDHCPMTRIEKELKSSRFHLLDTGFHLETSHGASSGSPDLTDDNRSASKPIANTVRPVEFHLGFAALFISLFATLIITLAVIFVKGRSNGHALLSRNRVVQNLIRNYFPTAIATFIEPMWILINRLLCMLQPIEGLLSMEAKHRDTISLNYNSLPSQLTVFTAIRTKHFMLATVCVMVLLANLLATTFSGLFYQEIKVMSKAANFQVFWQPRSPDASAQGPTQAHISAALLAESNYTAGTPLPLWTDEHRIYIPFQTDTKEQTKSSSDFRADTQAVGMEVDCEDLSIGTDFDLSLRMPQIISHPMIELSITTKAKQSIMNCTAFTPLELKIDAQESLLEEDFQKLPCSTGTIGAEFFRRLSSTNENATEEEIEHCESSWVLGWIRLPRDAPLSCDPFRLFNLLANRPLDQGSRTNYTNWDTDITEAQKESQHMKFMTCKPKLVVGDATVTVDQSGHITRPVKNFQRKDIDDPKAPEYSVWSNSNPHVKQALMKVVNLYYGGLDITPFHNDTFANDPLNYFMRLETNDSRFTDPTLPFPEPSEVVPILTKAIARLGAIQLGLDKEVLLQRTNSSQSRPGQILYQEERLLMKTSLFIISEVILTLYIITAILVYINRPKKFLPRLPNSIAAIISLFAASSAVRDLKGTSQFTTKERTKLLDESGFVYGYGSYVGVDGGVHVGIERAPFVRRRTTGRTGTGGWLSSVRSKTKTWI